MFLKKNYIILSQEIPGFPDKKNFQQILLKTHHSTTTSLAWPEFTCRSRFFGVTGNGQLPLAADISLNISPSCGTCRPTEWWCISQNQSWVYMEMPRIRSCWLICLIFSKVPVFQNGQGPAKTRGKKLVKTNSKPEDFVALWKNEHRAKKTSYCWYRKDVQLNDASEHCGYSFQVLWTMHILYTSYTH